MTYIHAKDLLKVKIRGHSIQKFEQNRWTDERTDGGDCIISRVNSVG